MAHQASLACRFYTVQHSFRILATPGTQAVTGDKCLTGRDLHRFSRSL